jgi:DNA helicase-like protein
MSPRIAADMLGDLIVKRDHFRSLLTKLQKIIADLFLTGQSSSIISADELNGLLRYADVLSHSKEPDYRQLAYLIVALLREYDSTHQFDHNQRSRLFAVTEAILVQLGNFPGLKTLQKNGEESEYALPLSRGITRIAKEVIQRTGKGDGVLTDTQYAIKEKMLDEGFFSFSGPTSLGKSFIIKDKLYDLARHDRLDNHCVVILVPTKALITQTAADLRQLLSDVPEVNVAVYPSLPKFLRCKFKRTIFVFTPERLLRYLANPVRDISYLIIDEAQKIIAEHDTRSSLYYHATVEVIRRFATKLIFASPSLDNPDIFLQLFGKATNGSMATRERTVAQQRYFIDLVDRKQYYVSAMQRTMSELDAPPVQDDIIDVILSKSGNSKSIIYINGSMKSAEFAMNLSARKNVVDDVQIDTLIDDVKGYIHKDYYLASTLRCGVAFHHGKMPQEIRESVERIFADPSSPVQFVVCTSTLLEGVNLPAKNIFILADKHGGRNFSEIDFNNLAGRAGRLTYDFSGNVVCIRHGKTQWSGTTRDLVTGSRSVHADSFLVGTNKRRKKEYTDIEHILKGEPLPGNASESRRRIAEHYASILTLHEIDGHQSLLHGHFLEKISGARELLSRTTKSIGVPPDALRRSPGILPLHQERVLKYLHDELSSPLIADAEHLDSVDTYFKVLRILSDLYDWRATEVSGRAPLMPKQADQEGWETRLRYWAILMRNWVRGYPICQIIARAISYHTQLGEITYRDYSRSSRLVTDPFNKDNPKHINVLIEKTLTDIENGLRFRIVSYLQNYYDLSDMILGPNASGINVATLVEYGTTDRKAIELQEVGFSRDVSRELLMRCKHLIFFSQDNELDNLDYVDILKIKELSDQARAELENIMMKNK